MKRVVIADRDRQKIKIAQIARQLGVSRSWAGWEIHKRELEYRSCYIRRQERWNHDRDRGFRFWQWKYRGRLSGLASRGLRL